MPESIKIAFHCFSDIQVTCSYNAPDRSHVPTGGAVPLSDPPQFNFTEWWNIRDGERIGGSFDIRDELIPELLRALEKVCTLFHLSVLK